MKKAIVLLSVFITLFLVRIVVAEPSSEQCVGNIESKLVHRYECNHLPDKEHQVLFSSKAEAEKAGYRECPVCFKTYPDILGYDEERALGMEMAGCLRYYNPLSVKGQLQEKLNAVGERVLANWPFPKRGYSYEFHVLQSEEINALGVPTGFVFVTTELLNMMESDEELEAILAHEIAHIEQRHAYREYKTIVGAMTPGVFAPIAVAAGGIDTTELQIAALFYFMGWRIVLFGHTKDNENEADALAKIYLMKNGRSEEKLLLCLKKIEYWVKRKGSMKEELLPIHPRIEERIARIATSRVSAFDKGNLFIGFDSKGEKVAELIFLWKEFYERKYKIVAVLRVDKASLLEPFISAPGAAPPGLGKGISSGQEKMLAEIVFDNKKFILEVKKIALEGRRVELAFTTYGDTIWDRHIQGLSFSLPGLSRWEMVK
jgi:hypothetical protein